MGEFNTYDHYIYYCGQEFLRRNGVAIIVNKTVQKQYLDAISKMTEQSIFVSKANHSISQFSSVYSLSRFTHFSSFISLIPKMSMLALAISYLTTSNLP